MDDYAALSERVYIENVNTPRALPWAVVYCTFGAELKTVNGYD
jgi:hypothetical protein